MNSKPQIKTAVSLLLKQYETQTLFHHKAIKQHEEALAEIEKNKKIWREYEVNNEKRIVTNQPLTRAYVKQYLQTCEGAVQTVTVIDKLYLGITDEERSKLIKHLSVIFNQMEQELKIEKKSGVKGNFYQLKSTK